MMTKHISKNFDDLLDFLSWCEDEANIDIHEPLNAFKNIKEEFKRLETNCKSLQKVLEEIAKEEQIKK